MTPIPFAPHYYVTRDGEIFSAKRSQLRKLKPQIDQDGYPRVMLCVGGREILVGIHRIVCATFNGPPSSPGMLVRHLDDVKTNNTPQNLSWGEPLDNTKDMFRNGGHRSQRRPESYGPSPKIAAAKREYWATHDRLVGSKNKTALLDERDIPLIFAAAQSGERHRDIAARFGVSRSCVSLIVQGKSWQHVPRSVAS